jgi:hypothetical protein
LILFYLVFQDNYMSLAENWNGKGKNHTELANDRSTPAIVRPDERAPAQTNVRPDERAPACAGRTIAQACDRAQSRSTNPAGAWTAGFWQLQGSKMKPTAWIRF